jgi:hypothetical protein
MEAEQNQWGTTGDILIMFHDNVAGVYEHSAVKSFINIWQPSLARYYS